jgi:hypothetical protein
VKWALRGYSHRSSWKDRTLDIGDQTHTAITTEHFGLVGARAQAASESASRSALYLGTLSSALIGLGLTSQASDDGDVFLVFTLVALPTIFLLGVFTFVRLVELGIEDFLLGRAINRIRHLYIENAGEARRYFLLSDHDDAFGVISNMGIRPSRWQLYFTAAVAVGVVNAVVGGSAVAVALAEVVGLDFGASVAAGAAVGLVALVVALRFQARQRGASGGPDDVLSPTAGGDQAA